MTTLSFTSITPVIDLPRKKKTYQLFSNTQVNKHCHIIPVKEHLHLQNSGLCNLKQTDHTKIGKSVTKMNFSAPSKRGIHVQVFESNLVVEKFYLQVFF